MTYHGVLEASDIHNKRKLPGKQQVVELKSGGKDVNMANDNKLQYIYVMADYKLNRQHLYGGNHDIDVDDLRSNTKYSGGKIKGSRTVKLFWEVLRDFEPKERCVLIKFVASCSRSPLLCFKHVQPSYIIHKIVGKEAKERWEKVVDCRKTLPF
uniref:HECT-type E3 ubiquitin transferase n=1 Tax=Tanacetum cinerariifolium TaxID=118510 RepID=A0A699I3L4_TANCI|nr:hypothetical protein [Tanacetum cinerariifolium]